MNKNNRIRQINTQAMSYYDEHILNIYLAFFRDVKGYSNWDDEEILNSTNDDDLQEFFTCMYDLLNARYLNTNHFEKDKLKKVKIEVEK